MPTIQYPTESAAEHGQKSTEITSMHTTHLGENGMEQSFLSTSIGDASEKVMDELQGMNGYPFSKNQNTNAFSVGRQMTLPLITSSHSPEGVSTPLEMPKFFVDPAMEESEPDEIQYGICCAIFRNESPILSSTLILEAEQHAWARWPGQRLYTYVNGAAIRSTNPGYCYLKAGWSKCGATKSGLVILEKLP